MLAFSPDKQRPRKTWVAAGTQAYLVVEHTGVAAQMDEFGTVRPYSAVAILDDDYNYEVLGSFASRDLAFAACRRAEREL